MSSARKSAYGAAVVAAAVALLLWWSTRSEAAVRPSLPPELGPEPEPEWPQVPIFDDEGYVMPDDGRDRLSAFLYMIRTAEHGQWRPDADRYTTFYSGLRFSNLADHPVITGERQGVRLPDRFCRAAGLSPGCVSTAAGAYQIIRPTWNRVRAAGAWGPRLPDFGVDSQDEAARRILMQSGALARLDAGDVEGAIRRAATQWASLPGSTSGQPQKSMAQALAYYQDGLDAQG